MVGTVLSVAVAVVAVYLIYRIGLKMLASFSTPVPEPPPPGEMRKVRLEYRCSVCGAEIRMTLANDEIPEAPRHCMEDMDLVKRPE